MAEKPAIMGATAFKPIERHGMEAVSWFFFDKDTGAIMGRTPKSWALITTFYIIYYIFLAAFWALCMLIFMQTIDYDYPRWQQEKSRIGRSPALGVRPGQTDRLLDSGLIIFNENEPNDAEGKIPGWQGWVNRTEDFLNEIYHKTEQDCMRAKENIRDIQEKKDRRKLCKAIKKNGRDCKNGRQVADTEIQEFCFFDRTDLGECTKENKFGFNVGKPCILLKLNKIYGLIPDYYNKTDEIKPNQKGKVEVMPDELRLHIKEQTNKNQVWVDCHGENAMDKEAMGSVTYYPTSRGFPEIYYEYVNQKGYQSPLIAVQFNALPIGVMMHVECRAYAKNIGYDRNDRIGKAHFEILRHNEKSAECVHNTAEGKECIYD